VAVSAGLRWAFQNRILIDNGDDFFDAACGCCNERIETEKEQGNKGN